MEVVRIRELPKNQNREWTVYDGEKMIAVGDRKCIYALPEEELSDEAKNVLKKYAKKAPRAGTITFVTHEAVPPYNVSGR